MSLKGNASAQVLKGRIKLVDTLLLSAYGVAVQNGFKGTEEEWLESLKGAKGDKGDRGENGTSPHIGENGNWFIGETDTGVKAGGSDDEKGSAVKVANIALLADKWVGNASPYSQVVAIEGITEYSQVDLKPSVEQLSVFHDKDLAFVTENDDGVVTVYAIGDKPTNDYTIQVSITEVNV